MRAVWCGFALGVMVLQQQAVLPSTKVWCLLIAAMFASIGVAMWCHAKARGYVVVGSCVLLFASACIGFGYAAWRAELRLATSLPHAWEGRDIDVTGYVDGLTSSDAIGVRFLFHVDSVDAPIPHFPRTLQLSWIARDAPPPALPPGSRWRLPVRLKRPHGNENPGVRDIEAAWLERDVRATGYVSAPIRALRLSGDAHSVDIVIDRWRDALRARIDAVLADAPHRGIVVALAVGAQDAVSAVDWNTMRVTGTSHLIAISGLHIGFVAGFAAWLVGGVWRRSGFIGRNWSLRVPAQKVAALGGAAFAAVHTALAGFNVPAQRTLWMLTVVALAFASGRTVPATVVLAWALGLVLVIDPWSVLSAGFWLSFCAVAAILFALSGPSHRALPDPGIADLSPLRRFMLRRLRAGTTHLREGARVQFAVTIALAPLTVWWFAQIPLVGPFANAVAIPWMSLLVTPAVLVGTVLPAPLDAYAFDVAHELLRALMPFLQWLAAPKWALWFLPRPGAGALACAALGVAWCLAPRGWPMRPAGAFALLPLLLPPQAGPPSGTFRLIALDIGQGSSILVQTAHHTLLFDAGPGPESTHAGERIVVPFLQSHGVTTLDALVVSHSDSDHAGGAPAVFDNIGVRQLLASLPGTNALWSRAIAVGADRVRCVAGQHWQWDGVDFAMLWPDPGPLHGKANDQCCVLRVSIPVPNGTPALAALLAADIEAPVERTLRERDPAALRAPVLLVPHHGSHTSSTEPFLDSVGPLVAVFQVGYRNRFHHPHPGVFARYEARHIELARSDDDGAVTIEAAGTTLSLDRYRDTQRRYWMDR
ncbi:DNA internalization-related competence protein ComEC/Rec2 [Paraburkholderia flava]|uniref:DNA internalization-related competence protein ComEC/Rec2 n=1 Tax=Paraburkholderia flava TaxID=2547393 RepID=UPI001061824D|nr:DNA internalization-related competence protein ComEC/Rec2 [Paraburkholderia flava]